jgi:hypothetical protein
MSDEKKLSPHVQKLVDEVKALSEEDQDAFEFATWNGYAFDCGMDTMSEDLHKAAKLLDGEKRDTYKVVLSDLFEELSDNFDEIAAMPDEEDEVCDDCKKAPDKERN